MRLFDREGDYQDFLYLFAEAQNDVPITCFAYCLMPNHFHFMLQPKADGDLSAFMFRLSMTHAKRWHMAHGTLGTGPVYQGRFKAFPVHTDHHFLIACRYVERNARRAGLCSSTADWKWSSVAQRNGNAQLVKLGIWPVERPSHWSQLLELEAQAETTLIRQSVIRSAPFGPLGWQDKVASRLEMKGSLARIGRPKKPKPGVLFSEP